ncbi:MAG: M1 family metallopeptidase [Candidatus Doudnabacteria bacterium]|nr:M1 family metallopeptidase [Candidatus Doudnabacteria bacterium]
MKSVRLSSHIKPERYRLFIKPDLKRFIFEGEETIYLNIEKPVNEITLHTKELKILQAKFRIKNYELRIKNRDIRYNEQNQTVTFKLKQTVKAGKGELSLKFTGILNDKMRGFYRSQYKSKNQQKHLATTQFEATDARRAFPCFDEPSAKAIFDVTLMVPKKLAVVSNTIESEVLEHQGEYKTVKFAPTPKMSTYLLAFIVGDLEYIEGRTRNSAEKAGSAEQRGKNTNSGTLVRVFTTPGKKHQAKFALDTAIRCLEFYNSYFDIPYPLPVLDLIAIPDFNSAAMENWGAITYRESALLIDEKNSSLSSKQWVAIVIAHEIAHQWFGNLVTMEWWTHLWLNEGFASYMEYLCTDKLFPQWNMWEQYVAQRFNTALELDSLTNTHPIEVEVHHPEEISEIFDAVSYAKGSVVIRMLAEYLGEKTFRDGLRYYLKKHSYQNASTIHLWEAFEKVSGKPVKKLMLNWTSAPGYPLVRVVEKEKQLVLMQSRFYSSAISKASSTDKTIWQIPVTIKNGKKISKHLLGAKSIKIPKTSKTWIKLNAGETSFFRTDYPAQMLGALSNGLPQLSAIDRLGVVRDAFTLSESGDLPATQALELVKHFKNEKDYNAWLMICFGLGNIGGLARNLKSYPLYEKFALGIIQNILQTVGVKEAKGETGAQVLLRSLILQQAVKWGDKKTVAWALAQFNKNSPVPVNLRSVVYFAAAQFGSSKEHAKLVKMYTQEEMQEEKDRIGRSLAHFKNPELLKKTLAFALSKQVRDQDAPFIIAAVFRNWAGSAIALDFVKKHWGELLKRYASGLSMISRIIGTMDNFYSEEKAKEIEKFFKAHKAPGAKRSIKQTLEKIRSQAAWLKRDGKPLDNWLLKQNEK